MTTIRLERLLYDAEGQGTFGKLILPSGAVLSTGELPWLENRNDVSCIPNGMYVCQWLESPRLKTKCYHVMNVPGRSGVLIHKGNFCGDTTRNWQADVLGCILLGESRDHIVNKRKNPQLAVSNSATALTAFETEMAQQSFELIISSSALEQKS